jgi:hypothetical protein
MPDGGCVALDWELDSSSPIVSLDLRSSDNALQTCSKSQTVHQLRDCPLHAAAVAMLIGCLLVV